MIDLRQGPLIAFHRPACLRLQSDRRRQYVWVLNERGDGNSWSAINRSKKAASTYKKAMAEGLVELESLMEDLDVGPRRSLKDQSSGFHQNSGKANKHAEEMPPKRPSLFGFGPAR